MKRVVVSFAVLMSALFSQAQAQVTVKDAWVRATVAQQKATGAFMQLQSSQDAKLISAQSPVAGVVEVHEMSMDGGVMKMRAIPSLALPAGKAVDLKPGGYHVMLIGLTRKLVEGERFPVTFVFEKAGEIEAMTEIGKLGAMKSDSMGSGGMRMDHSGDHHGSHKH